jgi:leucyl/phenylalanyl-tRNA--protein transferase
VHGTEPVITPDILLQAYACGIFPMADAADDPNLYWVEPANRGILPLDGFHVSRRLARTVRADKFEIRIDSDFEAVISGCAASRTRRDSTWINDEIRRLYGELFNAGHVHTIEAWRDSRLVGGLYGVHLASAFFGESMFSLQSDASKVALVHLVARLKRNGFRLLDTQFLTDHLARFGALEVPRERYLELLAQALRQPADFYCPEDGAASPPFSGAAVISALQSTSQMS